MLFIRAAKEPFNYKVNSVHNQHTFTNIIPLFKVIELFIPKLCFSGFGLFKY